MLFLLSGSDIVLEILSCSGYTLAYKFLCFIEKEKSYYLPKFFLIQSYKYILLILIVLFIRFSFYDINIVFNEQKRPVMEILKYILEYQYDNSFQIFFTFLLGYAGDSSIQRKQNLIQYLYLPINEIFFFIIGTLLISIGYKFKLKIDIIIIIIILAIFIGKILLFIFYWHENGKYPTLFFYLYDFGAYMLNPIYNFPSFLIGMYFGLINYSIQRGINLSLRESYQRIHSITDNEQSFSINEDIEEEKAELIKMETMDNYIKHTSSDLGLGNNNKNNELISSKNMYYQQQKDNADLRSFSQDITKVKSAQEKNGKGKGNITDSRTQSLSVYDNKLIGKGSHAEKIKEMPFLISPTKFVNCQRQTGVNCCLRILVIFFVLLIIFFFCVQFIYVGKYSIIDNTNINKDNKLLEKLSFEKIISNYFLNFIYVVDIDLVVFMINWGFFILYSEAYKSADIYDFFNNNIWSFFIKCYFSFILISNPIILEIFYLSETVVKFTLPNAILFSLINIILIFFGVIIFYSLYEMPLKKMFKTILRKNEILSENLEDDYDNDENVELRETKH